MCPFHPREGTVSFDGKTEVWELTKAETIRLILACLYSALILARSATAMLLQIWACSDGPAACQNDNALVNWSDKQDLDLARVDLQHVIPLQLIGCGYTSSSIDRLVIIDNEARCRYSGVASRIAWNSAIVRYDRAPDSGR